MDVVRLADNKALVDLAVKTYGRIDAIFLNAGIMPSSPISALKIDEWDQMVDVNIKGVLNGVAAAMPAFTVRKQGQIITVSSVAGIKNYPGAAVYGGTKWFVRNFMEVLRMESALEGTNIRTSTLYPAAINTELLNTITHPGTAAGMASLYEAVGISPDRIADVVAFAIDMPEDTNVNEFTVGPTKQAW
jgi:NADP-dependent 3-hydroxy acid dehydrogenase YdfG